MNETDSSLPSPRKIPLIRLRHRLPHPDTLGPDVFSEYKGPTALVAPLGSPIDPRWATNIVGVACLTSIEGLFRALGLFGIFRQRRRDRGDRTEECRSMQAVGQSCPGRVRESVGQSPALLGHPRADQDQDQGQGQGQGEGHGWKRTTRFRQMHTGV